MVLDEYQTSGYKLQLPAKIEIVEHRWSKRTQWFLASSLKSTKIPGHTCDRKNTAKLSSATVRLFYPEDL